MVTARGPFCPKGGPNIPSYRWPLRAPRPFWPGPKGPGALMGRGTLWVRWVRWTLWHGGHSGPLHQLFCTGPGCCRVVTRVVRLVVHESNESLETFSEARSSARPWPNWNSHRCVPSVLLKTECQNKIKISAWPAPQRKRHCDENTANPNYSVSATPNGR